MYKYMAMHLLLKASVQKAIREVADTLADRRVLSGPDIRAIVIDILESFTDPNDPRVHLEQRQLLIEAFKTYVDPADQEFETRIDRIIEKLNFALSDADLLGNVKST